MTTSRIYAYRWPARLVSHKPFAAERYFITSACNWQVFFQKNTNFLFYFLRILNPYIFCADCTISAALFQWKTPPRFRMALPGLFYTFLYKKPSSAEGSGEQLSVHSPVRAVHSYDLGGSFKGRCLTGSILRPSGKGCPGLSLLSQHPLL